MPLPPGLHSPPCRPRAQWAFCQEPDWGPGWGLEGGLSQDQPQAVFMDTPDCRRGSFLPAQTGFKGQPNWWSNPPSNSGMTKIEILHRFACLKFASSNWQKKCGCGNQRQTYVKNYSLKKYRKAPPTAAPLGGKGSMSNNVSWSE